MFPTHHCYIEISARRFTELNSLVFLANFITSTFPNPQFLILLSLETLEAVFLVPLQRLYFLFY